MIQQNELQSSHNEVSPIRPKNVYSQTDICYERNLPLSSTLSMFNTTTDTLSCCANTGIQDERRSQNVVFDSKGDQKNQSRGVVKPCGLANLGNTCYMNAALQGLGSVADLKDHFENGMYCVYFCACTVRVYVLGLEYWSNCLQLCLF